MPPSIEALVPSTSTLTPSVSSIPSSTSARAFNAAPTSGGTSSNKKSLGAPPDSPPRRVRRFHSLSLSPARRARASAGAPSGSTPGSGPARQRSFEGPSLAQLPGVRSRARRAAALAAERDELAAAVARERAARRVLKETVMSLRNALKNSRSASDRYDAALQKLEKEHKAIKDAGRLGEMLPEMHKAFRFKEAALYKALPSATHLPRLRSFREYPSFSMPDEEEREEYVPQVQNVSPYSRPLVSSTVW